MAVRQHRRSTVSGRWSRSIKATHSGRDDAPAASLRANGSNFDASSHHGLAPLAVQASGCASPANRGVVYSAMSSRVQREGLRRAAVITHALAEDVRRLRTDAGVSQRALARAAGVDQSVISRLEAGIEVPSIETYARLGSALGADLSIKLYPNTGPAIHDRRQAPIVEALLRDLDARWRAWPEVGVRQPVRGWIDVVLVDQIRRIAVATEVESSILRLEQLIRWANAKASALDSSRTWPFEIAGDPPSVDRLLILRGTRANAEIAATFAETLRSAYPGDPWQALGSLRGTTIWPGPSLLWAVDRQGGGALLVPQQRPHRAGVGTGTRQ
jgi:transcriptional regulator with XRE-family HTH domain